MFYFIFMLFLLQVHSLEPGQPVVETLLGSIRGHYKQSYGGRNFSAFEGIPYANPPLGKLRFKEPQNREPWSGIWEATTEQECIQLNTQTFQVIGNEDCLYLNVYVPRDKPNSKENLDVIVYIHGGAFMFASPAMGGPEYLMDRDIVYVSINYRLGLMGFLSTEDDVISGNSGLKDQVLALQWVQNHIEQFGGNPKSVTLLGLSAGGAAVHLHYFSSLSRGLFHRGISQSGTALCPWVLQEAPLEKARKLALLVGCNGPTTKELVKCLQQRSAQQLVQNTVKFFAYRDFPLAPFAPVIEKKSAAVAFLTEHPYKLLEKGNVNDIPWITSVTLDEGVFPVVTLMGNVEDIEEHWDKVLPYLLDYNYTVTDINKVVVAQKIKKFYFENQKLSLENVRLLMKIVGDRYFKLAFEKAARMQAKANKSPVYSYIYGYEGEQSLSNIFKLGKNYGVAHGEDGFLLHYVTLFGTMVKKEKLIKSDELIKDLLLDIVTSFAKNGEPKLVDVDWKRVTNSNDFGYLFIQKPDQIRKRFEKEVAPTEFWHLLPIMENENTVTGRDEL